MSDDETGAAVEVPSNGQSPPTVCILAGGLGTRLGERSRAVPKAMVDVAGEPFVFHQLRLLARQGFERVVLCVGHLGDQIERAVGARCFGMDVVHSYDGPELDGTLGAIRRAATLLGSRFLVLYGDTYLRVNFRAFDRAWVRSGLAGGMTVLHNRSNWDRSNVAFSEGRVLRYEKGSLDLSLEWIDYGLSALTAEALALVAAEERDLSSLQRVLAARGELFGFEVTDRFYEIGTPDSLAETEAFLASGSAERVPGRGHLPGSC